MLRKGYPVAIWRHSEVRDRVARSVDDLTDRELDLLPVVKHSNDGQFFAVRRPVGGAHALEHRTWCTSGKTDACSRRRIKAEGKLGGRRDGSQGRCSET